MPLRRTVRKLSSKSAMDTPTFVAWAVDVIRAAIAAARISFFIIWLLFLGARPHPDLAGSSPKQRVSFRQVTKAGGVQGRSHHQRAKTGAGLRQPLPFSSQPARASQSARRGLPRMERLLHSWAIIG